jgi:hypothetical protein
MRGCRYGDDQTGEFLEPSRPKYWEREDNSVDATVNCFAGYDAPRDDLGMWWSDREGSRLTKVARSELVSLMVGYLGEQHNLCQREGESGSWQ